MLLGATPSGALALAAALSVGAAGGAQTSFHASTSSDTTVGGETLDDAALLTLGGGSPQAFFRQGHWLAAAGFVPTDVDAFGRVPWAPVGSAQSFAFSLLSNEGGFLDGDVLSFAVGGGLEALVTEAELLNVLGRPTFNIDVDALAFDDGGCLYFSLQSDLAGTTIGDLSDGDVVCYQRSNNKVWLERSEDDIQLAFLSATGITTAISDVQAIDVVGGDLWVVPQSPSSHDGAVLALAGTPSIVAEEVALGLGGAELDALSVVDVGEQLAVVTLDPERAAPGDPVTVTLRGSPSTVYVALMAGDAGWIDFGSRPGFGAWYLDAADPWLNTLLARPTPVHAVTDANGVYSGGWTLPAAAVHGLGLGGEQGWSFQVMALPTLATSAPFRIQKL